MLAIQKTEFLAEHSIPTTKLAHVLEVLEVMLAL